MSRSDPAPSTAGHHRTPRAFGCRHHRISTASKERLFDLVADADNWQLWGKPLVPVSGFASLGPNEDGQVGSVREVGRPPVTMLERTTIFESPDRFGYEFVKESVTKNYQAVVTFEDHPAGTLVTWSASWQPAFRFGGRAVEAAVGKIILVLLKALVRYADENPGLTQP